MGEGVFKGQHPAGGQEQQVFKGQRPGAGGWVQQVFKGQHPGGGGGGMQQVFKGQHLGGVGVCSKCLKVSILERGGASKYLKVSGGGGV